ncbi:hypothetical protein ACFQPA_02925 [Halomarina halobia]|uniref:Uncharacterized protein n=1 Tax=Halomarina halobia TaxID=3033386 RepID=A0ABD6A4R9_9EURY|nr:hypothetical protein [Halomarina sp. PSR21]
MAATNPSTVVNFDADAARAAALDVAGDDLLLVVEFDRRSFNPLYLTDRVREYYDDEAAMARHFEEIHSYIYLDFTERDLYEDLYPPAGESRAFATYLEEFVALRVLFDGEGLFLALAPDADVTGVVGAVEGAA